MSNTIQTRQGEPGLSSYELAIESEAIPAERTEAEFLAPQVSLSNEAAKTPYVSGDVNAFRDLFFRSRYQKTRVAIVGDSQESYGGAGQFFLPALQAATVDYFGDAPETEIMPSALSYGSGSPIPRFCHRGAFSAINRVDDDTRLPGFPTAITARFGNTFNYLLPKCEGVSVVESRDKIYLDGNKTTLKVEAIFERSTTGPAEGRIRQAIRTVPGGPLGDTFVTDTESVGLGLDTSDDGFVSFQSDFLQPTGSSDLYTVIQLTTPGFVEGAKIIGSRIIDTAKTAGLVFSSFSAGGYTTDLFFQNHGNAGPQLAAFGPWDAVFCPMSANHIRQTNAEYEQSLRTFITTIRSASWLNNPDQLIVLVSDDWSTLIGTGVTEADLIRRNEEFARVQSDIAESESKVVFFNMQRFGEDSLLGRGRRLQDGVHLDPLGQAAKGDLVMASWARIANGEV